MCQSLLDILIGVPLGNVILVTSLCRICLINIIANCVNFTIYISIVFGNFWSFLLNHLSFTAQCYIVMIIQKQRKKQQKSTRNYNQSISLKKLAVMLQQ